MDRDTEQEVIRRAYAKRIMASIGVSSRQIEDAFAAVKREDFLEGGPWQRHCPGARYVARGELFDEVTSALDLELVGEVLAVMWQFGEDGTTVIVVTHEIAFARDIADHVLFMDAGAIAEHGPAEDVLVRPANPRTRAFLSRFHHAGALRSAR